MPPAPVRRAISESSDVAKFVRLHHRRRGWAWVAIGSVIGLVMYAGIDLNLFENLTGTAGTLSVIPVFVLLALVLAGLVVVIVDTSLWAWGSGRNLTSGDGSAIPTIVAGLFYDGVTLLLLYALVVLVRDTPSRRRQRMSVPAGADPDGVRRTHHPDRGHHGSGELAQLLLIRSPSSTSGSPS